MFFDTLLVFIPMEAALVAIVIIIFLNEDKFIRWENKLLRKVFRKRKKKKAVKPAAEKYAVRKCQMTEGLLCPYIDGGTCADCEFNETHERSMTDLIIEFYEPDAFKGV